MAVGETRAHTPPRRNPSMPPAPVRVSVPMKTHSSPVAVANPAPSETAIRGYAFFLYEQSGHAPGRDLDNWLEASAHLHARAAAPAPDIEEATPTFGVPESGHVHAAAGHVRAVKEKTAHTTSRRHA